MLSVWQRTEDLGAAIEEVEIEREQTMRELELLCRANKETGAIVVE